MFFELKNLVYKSTLRSVYAAHYLTIFMVINHFIRIGSSKILKICTVYLSSAGNFSWLIFNKIRRIREYSTIKPNHENELSSTLILPFTTLYRRFFNRETLFKNVMMNQTLFWESVVNLRPILRIGKERDGSITLYIEIYLKTAQSCQFNVQPALY